MARMLPDRIPRDVADDPLRSPSRSHGTQPKTVNSSSSVAASRS